MATTIQFHATPYELADLLATSIRTHHLFATALEHPFRTRPLDIASVVDGVVVGQLKRVILSVTPLKGADDVFQLVDLNPSVAFVDIGQLTRNSLTESCFSTRAGDAPDAPWSQVAKQIKKSTKAGALAVNPKTGATVRMRTHRYTAGAMALQEQGIRILPAAGNSELRLGMDS